MPGTELHFCLINNKLSVFVNGELSFFSHKITPNIINNIGGVWFFDLFVRNVEAPLTECSTSITTGKNTVVFTNMETLGEVWSAEDVMAGNKSKWLDVTYSLIPDADTVKPNEWMGFTFTVYDGKTGEVADDVNYDNFIITPVDGYCPHQRFAVKNGVGRFRMKALDLEEGETMRVKAGVRWYLSRAEAEVTVRS